MTHLPTAVGLTICQDYIIQEKTRRVTLVNCSSKYTAKSFPAVLDPFTVCVKLTDAFGTFDLSLVIYRLATMDEVFTMRMTAEFKDRMDEVWYFARVRQCSFPEPGRYQVALSANGEFVAHCTIEIINLEDVP